MTAKTPNPIDVHVGKRIRMWRVERRISRITLGEAIGLTEQQIQEYERGANRIGVSRLQQICTLLEIPVSFVFETVPGSSPGESGMPQDVIDFMKLPEGARLARAFSKITDRKMRRFIAQLTNKVADHMQRKESADKT